MRYRDIVHCITSQGWQAQSQHGSHHIYSKEGCDIITIAFNNINDQVSPGISRDILAELRSKGVDTSDLE